MVASPSCICLFSALYAPNVGGVEIYTANLAHALAALGHRVIVVTSNVCGLPEQEQDNGVEVIRLPSYAMLSGRFPVPRRNATFRRLMSWLERQDTDHIVVNTRFYPLSREGLAFAQAKGVVPVLIEHGSAHLTMGGPFIDTGIHLAEHAMTRRALKLPASYYAVSRKASVWLSHFDALSRGELSNSIDADVYLSQASTRSFRKELNLPPNAFVAAFVGRLVREKGILELARAVELVGDSRPVVVLAAGEGPLRTELALFEGDRFHLLGSLNRADVAALLSEADVLCLPSRSEGFATALLEAAACWTPAIVTDVGGTDELVPDSRFGTVIPNADPPTIARALKDAAADTKTTALQGRLVGRLVRNKYSWKQAAEHVLAACRAAQDPANH